MLHYQVVKASVLPTREGDYVATVTTKHGTFARRLAVSPARAALFNTELTTRGFINPVHWTLQDLEAAAVSDEMPGNPALRAAAATVTAPVATVTIYDRLQMVLPLLPSGRQAFAADLLRQATQTTKPLSDKQEWWVAKLVEMGEAAAQPAATKPPAAEGIKLDRISEMFASAKAKGLKKPSIRICVAEQTLTLKPAAATSRNPGHIYVTIGEEYKGKISPEGTYTGNDDVVPALRTIAADPAKAATVHGQMTGNCCFCNRDLTDKRSVDVGYGPICADKFGLPWGE